MPNLECISLDWFSYLVPHLNPVQFRQEDCNDIDLNPLSGFQKLADLMDQDSNIDFPKFIKHFGMTSVNQVDKQGRSMLHQAACKGDQHIVDTLIVKLGADSSVEDNYKFSPYGLAMREEQFDTAYSMLCKPTFLFKISGAGTFGTQLHLAVSKLQVNHV